jgi:hypothetical protein
MLLLAVVLFLLLLGCIVGLLMLLLGMVLLFWLVVRLLMLLFRMVLLLGLVVGFLRLLLAIVLLLFALGCMVGVLMLRASQHNTPSSHMCKCTGKAAANSTKYVLPLLHPCGT